MPRSWSWQAPAILLVLVIATMCSYVDRTILSLLVGPIRHDLRVTDLKMSLLLGPAFATFYALMGLPLGWAADRRRRLRLAAAGVALWSLATALSGFSQEFWQLFLARTAVAVGEAVLLPTSISLVADSFAPAVRTRMLGVLGMSIYWGTGIAFLFGGFLAGAVGHLAGPDGLVGGFRPWQVVLVLVGLPGIPIALALALLPEPRRQATATPRAGGSRFERATIVEYGWLTIAVGAMAIVGYSLASWAPSHLIRAYGWKVRSAGAGLGAGFVVATTSIIWLATFAADRLAQRGRRDAKYLILGCCTSAALPLALVVGLVHDATVFVAAASIAMGASAACIAMGPAAVCALCREDSRGRAVAVYQMAVGLIGGALGAPAVAIAASYSAGLPGGLGLALCKVTSAGFLVATLIFWSRRHGFASASRA